MSNPIFKRGLHKMIHNFFVMKSNSFLNAKSAKNSKPVPPKPSPPKISKCKRTERRRASKEANKAALWKKISFFGAFPTIGLVAVFVFTSKKNEPEKERPPFVKYDHLRIRHKRFPWGDGDRSFFHNPSKNALSNGYEDD